MSQYSLFLDTSMDVVQLCLLDHHDNSLQSFIEKVPFRHVETLIPRIQTFLKEARVDLKDLSSIYCVRGPGSFTGIRISLVTVKALSYVLSLPCGGISSFDILLYSLSLNTLESISSILCAVSAGRGRFYVQEYLVNDLVNKVNLRGDPLLKTKEDIESSLQDSSCYLAFVCVGDEDRSFFESLSVNCSIYPSLPLPLFIQNIRKNLGGYLDNNPQNLLPLYILPSVRPSSAT